MDKLVSVKSHHSLLLCISSSPVPGSIFTLYNKHNASRQTHTHLYIVYESSVNTTPAIAKIGKSIQTEASEHDLSWAVQLEKMNGLIPYQKATKVNTENSTSPKHTPKLDIQ